MNWLNSEVQLVFSGLDSHARRRWENKRHLRLKHSIVSHKIDHVIDLPWLSMGQLPIRPLEKQLCLKSCYQRMYTGIITSGRSQKVHDYEWYNWDVKINTVLEKKDNYDNFKT